MSLTEQDLEMVPVVLSGGTGTRLWPQSRASRPKQFIELLDGSSLFRDTLERCHAVTTRNPVVVTNEAHRFLVAEELRQTGIDSDAIILEPVARNTAPAIALAALAVVDQSPDAIMLVCPSDHRIKDVEGFVASVEQAARRATGDRIITFGVEPDRPETGYGYIKADAESGDIDAFIEKPEREKAEAYLAGGDYFWNTGVFVVRAAHYLALLQQHAEDIHRAVLAAWQSRSHDGLFVRVDPDDFEACPSDSIDYAIMERTNTANMVPLRCDWSDLGSWDAVWRASEQDANGNAAPDNAIMIDSHGNYVNSDRQVAMLGCDNLVVIDAGDALLVADRERSQEVKQVVDALKVDRKSLLSIHPRVYRPWGDYESIDEGGRYQVKRIVVKPGERLSLQRHHHRAEHWTVVRGTARVTRDDEVINLYEDMSTYLPMGCVHRLENPGKIPLELIEVQTGSYLGEDDIERLDDKYGRKAGSRIGGEPTDSAS